MAEDGTLFNERLMTAEAREAFAASEQAQAVASLTFLTGGNSAGQAAAGPS